MTDSYENGAGAAADGGTARERLLRARAAADEQIAALSRDYEGIVASNALAAVDDEHDPEGSSTAFERAHVASLLAQAREHLAAMDRAMERLGRGEYGRCEVCGEPIPAERLEVLPATSTCTRCAAARTR
ncbi:transcriptional regulator, TraR/DksA family [Actinacidiphila yanglinensis]|uniref:Transcriptional regulator, TraR/DksA family n=1 Tax=Actinacidiphila yanglinensis TaxID=310779 RepID=A0A1H6AXW1_9ACTN|nr:TraR/DksA C4-type zinc finger protein [Actinacidiphila yanglinensis]SEG52897.1 transcriptional regulator, TraR/DksA family [Actinacidiphila yanglinensis]